MREAIRLANESVERGGGPFGAIIVKECLGAIYWARISRIFYGNNRKDARDIDFADDFIYEELDRPLDERTVPIIPLLRDEALISFRMWMAKEDKKEY